VAVVEKRVSDISGQMGDEMGRLTVVSHPKFSGPIQLDVLDDEVKGLEGLGDTVELEVTTSDGRTRRLVVAVEDFNRLGNMDAVLTEAVVRTAPRRAVEARTRGRQAKGRGVKVNYASLEYAGTPHRGRITDAEKEMVRNNLDKVNKRLRDQGQREINANDPTMRERYGL
jgi:hypothetical protein